jgi:signal peptidase I
MHRARATADRLQGLARHWSPLAVRALSAFYLYTLLWLILWAVVPAVVMQWQPVLITSGSMEPGIRAGDIVVAEPSDGIGLAPGTVVIFNDQSFDDRLVTHRITSIANDGSYITSGDANPGVDSTPLVTDEVAAVPRLLVSTVGLPLLWIEQGRYSLIAVWLLGTLAAGYLLRRPRYGGTSGDGEDASHRATPRAAWRRAPGTGRAAITIVVVALVSLNGGRSAASLADTTNNAADTFVASEWEALIALDGGEVHSCGVNDEGAVWCWGRNDRGQLGDGTTSDHSVPVQVVGAGGVGTLTNAVGIAAGNKHSCAAKDDGTVWCWGLNDKGQLGNNSTTNSSTPVQVVGAGGVGTLTNVADIAAGLQYSCAAKDDGTAWCWGLNNKGQLGNNSTTDSSTPVQVVGAGGVGTLTNVAEIAAGLQHSCAAKDDGTAWCWGLNDKGQLGNNSTTDSSTPVQVVGAGGVGVLDTIILVGAGNTHTCAAKQTHTVWCWGLNNESQLGNNSTTDSSTPVQAIGT